LEVPAESKVDKVDSAEIQRLQGKHEQLLAELKDAEKK